MPPIKGRMMSRMGGMQDIRNIKKAPTPKKKSKTCPIKKAIPLPEHITEDEKLMKLRMPNDIVRILPSVKKFKGGKDFVDLTDNTSVSGESSRSDWINEDDRVSVTSGGETKHIIGVKKGRGSQNKYVMKLLAEERFCSMIFAVNIAPSGEIYVSCCEGIIICDNELERKSKLDKVVLPGGIGFLPDGQVVAICRNSDTVNFFSKDGIFIKSFSAGYSPLDLIVCGKDKLVITDPGDRCVRVYDTKGNEVHKISTLGKSYRFQWPLYLAAVDEQCFIVSDCHAQNVNKFKNNGKFVSTYRLHTVGSNTVLRPHGVCTFREDLFVVDTSLDCIEVFSKNDSHVQTLIQHEDALSLKPKCMGVHEKNGVFVVGGRTGVVRVYEFLDTEYYDFNRGENVEMKIKQENEVKQKDAVKVKQEVKSELDMEQMDNPDNKDNSEDEEHDDVILLD